ncbi:MAG: sporadic carbohydrate cluster protein, TIGR04323 family [Proteobacteria bacterium]|nr:sporadic carbohydrate cluster protein, TIGR04323 family [Pseudomonadota bacterium]
MSERRGYRGYIGSRPLHGSRTPQHVQNLVVRDYCQRHGLTYLLSAVEYAMPGCYLMLTDVLNELPSLEGIVAYSLFMLPADRDRRLEVHRRVLESGAAMHFALEGLKLAEATDVARLEDIRLVQQALAHAPQRV